MSRKQDKAVAIIPARMGSTRFPGKALADETGKPMVVHVCEQASRAESIERVVVATDAREIFDAVNAHGFDAVMTSDEHTNGSSRLAEAAETLKLKGVQWIVNVQGDEPEIEPECIDAAARATGMLGDPPLSRFVPYGPSVGTVASPITDPADFENPNVVKAVVGILEPDVGVGNGLYFSRSPIPYCRDGLVGNTPLRHVGIYSYTVAALRRYLSWEPTPLERTESLEQLRWLEHGHAIAVAVRASSHTGIDTPEQYRAFVERWHAKN
ncbi:MAG: 3-deoxy-manno-octulosonate cytidylyltransferase [Phycisphaerales bacterium]|nr:3-deoxy-manno-octulosonate cytidylyltransferase [Phycisphaerales bacterium]